MALAAMVAVPACGGSSTPRDGAAPRDSASDYDSWDRDSAQDIPADVAPESDGGIDQNPRVDASDAPQSGDVDVPAIVDGAGAEVDSPLDTGSDAPGGDTDAAPTFARRWVSLGAPAGGQVSALAIATDGTLFAGVGSLLPSSIGVGTGIFVSRDSGESWQSINEGLRSFNIQDFALADGTMFGATKDIVRSVDRGRTWQTSLTSNQAFLTVAAGPGGRPAFTYEDFPDNILRRSDDGGLTWTTVTGSGQRFSANSIAVLGSVVLAFGENGLWRSTDSGVTFSLVGQAGRTLQDDILPHLLCGGGRCYLAGVATNGIGPDFLRSTDDGATWTPIGQPGYFPLAVSDGTVYVRSGTTLFRSDDGGATWTGLPAPPAAPIALAAKGMDVFAGTTNGVFRSVDRGVSWAAANGSTAKGALTTQAALLVVDTSSKALSPNGDLYVGAYGIGLLRSVDDGASWSVVKVGFVPTSCVVTEATGISCISTREYFRTTDHGVSWQPWTVPAFTDRFGSVLWTVAARGETMYVSGKATLTQLRQVARSDDGGLTFQPIFQPTTAGPELAQLQILANGHVLANSASDSYRSIDRGVTWTKLPRNLELPVAVDGSGVLYRGTGFGGNSIERSVNEADSWSGIDSHQTIPFLMGRLSPVWFDSAGTIYAATEGIATFPYRVGPWTLHASSDLGSHWALVAPQLPHPVVSSVAVDKRGRVLLATNGGVYRME